MSAAQADDQQLHTLAAAAATSTNSSSSLSSFSSSSSIAPASSSTDPPKFIHSGPRSRSRSRDRSGTTAMASSESSSTNSSSTASHSNLPGHNTTLASSVGSTRFARFSSMISCETTEPNMHRVAAGADSSSSSSSSLRTAHDLPPLRARAIPSSLISAKYYSRRDGYLPLPLKPNQLRPTRKQLQRFLKEIEHPLEYLDHPIRSESVHDGLHSIFLTATPLPNDVIGLIREYRLEFQPSQSLLVSAKFGSHHGDSRPFNTAAIVTSSAHVINEHNRFRDEEEYLATYTKEKLWNQMYRQQALEERNCREVIGPVLTAASTTVASIPKPTIIHSLSTLLYSGYSIREIVGYYGDVRKLGPSCFGVKFVYGPQIESAVDDKCTMSEDESLANRSDLGFVVSRALPKMCGYQRKHWRLHVDEYITRVTLHIGRWHFAVSLIFETNLKRKFEIGPMVDDDDDNSGPEGIRKYACEAAAEYIIETPPDHALIALTGSEGEHVHAIRGVYAAIRKPQKRQAEPQQKEVQHEHNHL